MNDNVHGVGVNDIAEQIEQDQIKVKTDLITIGSAINLDTVASNQTNFTNQLSGASTSGLKTLIEGNDTDISGINDKLDGTTSSGLKTLIDNKVSMVLGTTAGTALAGNTTTITTDQASKIVANENAIDAIELKTDYLDIGSNGFKYSHGNFLTGSAPGDQLLIQHADLNSGSPSLTACSMRVTSTGDLRLNVPTGRDYEFRINNVMQYNNTQIKNLVDSITFTDTPTLTNNLKLGNTTLEHTNLLVGESSPNQLVIQHANLNSGNLSTTDYSIRVTANGELRLNVPTGQDYEFRINNVLQYNNTQIKNLVDNVSITQNVDLDTIESDVTGIKNNTLASTLKTAVDANTSLSNANQFVITAFGVDIAGIKNNTLASTLKTAVDANSAKNTYPSADATKVGHISVTGAVNLDTINSNVSTNNAKVSSQWTNNGSEIHFNNNVGIRNSNPNSDLEIGDGTSNIRVRLNGQNGQAISSEIIFSDGFTTTNPEYYNGASIRFNSSQNRLEFLTDQDDDGTAEPAIFIVRATTPYVTMTDLFATNVSVNSSNLRPHSIYCYGRRVGTASDTDNNIELTTSPTAIIYKNILTNGITYNTSTGFFSVSVTGLYHVVATLQIDCGTGAESELQLVLKNGTTNVLKARTHVSRAESNNDTAMQFNMNAPVRLATGINYNFTISSNNTGSGIIQNDLVTNNSLMIKGLVLQNDTTIPSDWGESNT